VRAPSPPVATAALPAARLQMRRQAEMNAELQMAWQQKQELEEHRRLQREAEQREVSVGRRLGRLE
jgi:hypothetical protein